MADCNDSKKKSIKSMTGWNAFFKAVAPEVKKKLGDEADIGKTSSVVSKMWRQIGERRKDWRMKAQSTREDIDTGILDEKYVCTTCERQFNREKDLKYHAKGCHQCFCNECGQMFTHTLQLNRHNIKMHSKHYLCELCGKTFGTKSNLRRHSHVHSSVSLECEICGTKFSRKSNLKRHMKAQHDRY